jgi:hypothetical protein
LIDIFNLKLDAPPTQKVIENAMISYVGRYMDILKLEAHYLSRYYTGTINLFKSASIR